MSLFRGMLTSWRNEKTRTFHFDKGNVKICTWVRKNPIQQHWLGLSSWKAAPQRKAASQKHGLSGVSSVKGYKDDLGTRNTSPVKRGLIELGLVILEGDNGGRSVIL